MKAKPNLCAEKQSYREENLTDVFCRSDDVVPEKILSIIDVQQNLMPCAKDADFKIPATVSQPSTSQVSPIYEYFKKIDQAIGPGHGPADEALSTGYHIFLKRCDFQLLNNGNGLMTRLVSFNFLL